MSIRVKKVKNLSPIPKTTDLTIETVKLLVNNLKSSQFASLNYPELTESIRAVTESIKIFSLSFHRRKSCTFGMA